MGAVFVVDLLRDPAVEDFDLEESAAIGPKQPPRIKAMKSATAGT